MARRYFVVTILDGGGVSVTACRDSLEARHAVAEDSLMGCLSSVAIDVETEEIIESYVDEVEVDSDEDAEDDEEEAE